MSIEHLVKNSDLTPQQRKEKAHKAGVASGKARQEKKRLQESLRKLLVGNYTIKNGDIISTLQGYDAVATSMILQAISGNVKAATFVRDTIGEKPVEEIKATMGNENLLVLQEYLEDTKNGKLKKSQTKKD